LPQRELELVRIVVVARVPCPSHGRGAGRHPEVGEDTLHRFALRDHGKHAEPAVTLWALERVDVQRPSQEPRPVDALGLRVQRATQQPVPVANGDEVGREDREGRESDALQGLRRDASSLPRRAPVAWSGERDQEIVTARITMCADEALREDVEFPRSRRRSHYAAIFSIFALMNFNSNSIGLT
jgi:hypothetical protein